MEDLINYEIRIAVIGHWISCWISFSGTQGYTIAILPAPCGKTVAIKWKKRFVQGLFLPP
jgi:glycerol-3-phosphate acyltransferase PlsY